MSRTGVSGALRPLHDHGSPLPAAPSGDPDALGDHQSTGDTAPAFNEGSAGTRIVLVLLRIYQGARAGRVSPCRFTPTCSQYAVEAVQRHGVRRGLRLTIGRLGRCRPGGPFGSDPVPE